MEVILSNKIKYAPLTNEEIGRDYSNQLSKIEEGLKGDLFCKRLDLKKPVLEAFLSWPNNVTVLNGSAFSKAIIYA